jgi:hypothetical protein
MVLDTFFENPKTKHLMKLLNLREREVEGLMLAIWRFTKYNAPRGDIGKYTDEELEIALEWDQPGTLIPALLKARFFDHSNDPRVRFTVHQWHEHCEAHVHTLVVRLCTTFADGTFPHTGKASAYERQKFYEKYPDRRPPPPPPENVTQFPPKATTSRSHNPRQPRSDRADVPQSLAQLLERERMGG